MKKRIIVVSILALVCVNTAVLLAKDSNKTKAAEVENQAPAVDKEKQEKDMLIANINNLRNQELRVTILQQILNEEIAKWRNSEAVFADQYKLDLEKFRKGAYKFDDKSGKIVEQKPS